MKITAILFVIGICIFLGTLARYSIPDYKNEKCGFSEKASKEKKK